MTLIIQDCRMNQDDANELFGDALTFRVSPKIINKHIKKTCYVNNDWLQPLPFFQYFIVGGNWHTDFSYVCDDRNYLEMVELVDYRHYYRNSDSYRLNMMELTHGKPQKDAFGVPFYSMPSVDKTYRYYLSLIESMEDNGYLPFRESNKKEGDTDIGVAVAPNGELFHFRTGHHRLAIAKVLRLDSVQVKVHLVHSEWVQKVKSIRDGLLLLKGALS